MTMAEQLIGAVTHYYGQVSVAGVQITDGPLGVGDTVHFLGHTTDFTQTVGSMQIEHATVESAQAGDDIGMEVSERVRQRDKVYRVLSD